MNSTGNGAQIIWKPCLKIAMQNFGDTDVFLIAQATRHSLRLGNIKRWYSITSKQKFETNAKTYQKKNNNNKNTH